jgi:hypothetical protein
MYPLPNLRAKNTGFFLVLIRHRPIANTAPPFFERGLFKDKKNMVPLRTNVFVRRKGGGAIQIQQKTLICA